MVKPPNSDSATHSKGRKKLTIFKFDNDSSLPIFLLTVLVKYDYVTSKHTITLNQIWLYWNAGLHWPRIKDNSLAMVVSREIIQGWRQMVGSTLIPRIIYSALHVGVSMEASKYHRIWPDRSPSTAEIAQGHSITAKKHWPNKSRLARRRQVSWVPLCLHPLKESSLAQNHGDDL